MSISARAQQCQHERRLSSLFHQAGIPAALHVLLPCSLSLEHSLHCSARCAHSSSFPYYSYFLTGTMLFTYLGSQHVPSHNGLPVKEPNASDTVHAVRGVEASGFMGLHRALMQEHQEIQTNGRGQVTLQSGDGRRPTIAGDGGAVPNDSHSAGLSRPWLSPTALPSFPQQPSNPA